MTEKPKPAKTTNPLHFEDLEPHRFEDLIRQLAQDFRSWDKLEPTGRLGADDGTMLAGSRLSLAPPAARRGSGRFNLRGRNL